MYFVCLQYSACVLTFCASIKSHMFPSFVMLLLIQSFLELSRNLFYRTIQMLRKDLNWPSHVQTAVPSILGNFGKKDKTFNPSASESLTAYPALRCFLWSLNLERTPNNHHREVAYSLFCLFDLLDYLHQSMRRAIDPTVLGRLSQTHLAAFLEAYGRNETIPKHHYTAHLSECFQRQKYLLNCFCLERKHKSVKRFANNVHTIHERWSKGILQDVVLADYQALEEESDFFDRVAYLKPPLKAAPKEVIQCFSRDFRVDAGSLQTGVIAVVSSGTCKSGDVVCFDAGDGSDMFGEVMMHTCFGDEAWTIVNRFSNAAHANEFHRRGPLQWIETTKIKGAMIYRNISDDKIFVIPQNF